VSVCLLSVLYLWILYHVPVIVAGFRKFQSKSRKRETEEKSRLREEELPTVSIIVPVRNEEKVVGRLLDALLSLDYPRRKREIIVVNDGSTDKTVEICNRYATEFPSSVRFLQKSTSNGKPPALNYALRWAGGEIIGVFDADNVPEPNALLNAAKSFQDPSIAALQGKICSINADQNMLSKIVSFEEVVLYEFYPQGKTALDLSNHLSGTCNFIRRELVEKIGGWDENSWTEDMELSARLLEKNCNIKYDPDVRSRQETPASLTEFIRQRTRWYRGSMEVVLKHGNLLRKVNKKIVDAEISFAGPYMWNLCLVGYLIYIWTLFTSFPHSIICTIMAQIISLLTVVGLFMYGIVLVFLTKPRRRRNLLLVPLVYVYLGAHIFAALWALMQIVLRTPKKWHRTIKTGAVTANFQPVLARTEFNKGRKIDFQES
jgi:cellulose synthase/poly-beta-1,6-N-acetylglucosamine synthase-like glycosyltransferase